MMIRNRYLAAVNDKPWWLAGGIPRDACVAAWRFKDANNVSAAKYDFTNGFFADMSEGGWSSITGFVNSGKYGLPDFPKFGGLPNTSVSWIVKIANLTVDATTRYAFALRYVGTFVRLQIAANTGNVTLTNVNSYDSGVPVTDGVYAMGGINCYKDAILVGSVSAGTIGSFTQHSIGTGYATTNSKMLGELHSIAFYKTGLTQSQIAAVGNEMNAL